MVVVLLVSLAAAIPRTLLQVAAVVAVEEALAAAPVKSAAAAKLRWLRLALVLPVMVLVVVAVAFEVPTVEPLPGAAGLVP